MRPSPWPPTGALWAIVAGSAGGVVAALVAGAPTEWLALALALGLGAAAVAVDRHLGGRRSDAGDPRRLAPDETRQVRAVVERRPVLLRGTVALVALAGAGVVGWLWRLAPRRAPGTGWADGVRAVDSDGRPVRAGDLPPGGIVTAWPEGNRDRELAAVVVLRLTGPAGSLPVSDGAVVAYSRICTHAGCPVALFRAEESTLYCPCHQATFDARRGAEPVFGPASRPLPSLPLGTDADGFLVARGDLSTPPGPETGGRS